METGEEPHPRGSASSAREDTHSLGEGNSHESSRERPDQCLREYLRLLSADYVCECQLCDNETLDMKELQNILPNRKTYICDVCPYQTLYSSNLSRHMDMHIGKKSYTCDECEYRTHSLDNIKKHKVKHTGVKYACDMCQFKTLNKQNLLNHIMVTHSGSKSVPIVNLCGTLENTQLQNKLVERKTEKETYTCNVCQFKTTHTSSLRRHKQYMHNTEKLHKCDECKYITNRPDNLKKHKLKHSKVKFSCGKCEYQTVYKHYLVTHQFSHLTETIYTCDLCNYKTFNVARIKVHKRKHDAGKIFKCDFCSYTTSSATYINKHKNVHIIDKKHWL